MGKLRDTNVSCVENALFCARVMQAVAEENFSAAQAMLTAEEPTINGVYSIPSTNDNPAFLIAKAPAFDAVFVAGCVNLPLAVKCLTGWAGPIGDTLVLSEWNSFARTVSTAIRGVMVGKGAYNGVQQIYVGHSFGGMVAQDLANLCRQDGATRGPSYTTFGSPKLGQVAMANANRSVPGLRWMMDTDPIPLLPFTLEDFANLISLALPRQIQEYGQFVHWRGGLLIDGHGEYVPAELPNIPIPNALTSIASFLLAYDNKSLPGHGMGTYVSALDAARLASESSASVIRNVGSIEEPISSSRREMTTQEARIVTAISGAQVAQNRPVLVIPPTQLFRVVRSGRVFLVTFGDHTIGMTVKKKTARSLARQFNVAFRHLQTTAIVQPETFLNQLQAYFTAAVDPTSGFSPTINTTLPL